MANIAAENISKRNLWKIVNKKVKRFIHHYHVFAIITILFEEMLVDLKNSKDIKILNLGTISLKNMKPRHYHNVVEKKVMLSTPHKILRFKLFSKIKKKICKHLDIDKTFKDD